MRQLQYFWPKAVGGGLPRLVERKVQLVAEAGARCRVRLDQGELRDVTGEIEWAKVPRPFPPTTRRRSPSPSATPARPRRDLPDLRDVRGAQARPRDDRLRGRAAPHGRRPPGPARHRRADRSQYQHFVVDEYQDVSPLQQRLLELWLGEQDSLCVVGDASQTIYSFTGATPTTC
ncbi:UvrD-helicase domain-containing protein [Streptomyces sp. BPTC-684]|uniref:UvrD-helicase domain-containing protein n=1 Tax=Streptomyces sp. BPTC-684 TaxID=3043734 RepID=UPI0024B12EFA|nr:UvrD-helicase domain-containing protein [Streptomyces sp. BPTC-684]WHM41235.1 UvrD-helicase domain-containing protein [Streptomyces sp. BPTC-684]